MISERSILIGLNHPFIVNLATTFQDPRYLYMVLEYVQVRTFSQRVQWRLGAPSKRRKGEHT